MFQHEYFSVNSAEINWHEHLLLHVFRTMKLVNQDRKYPFQYSINKFAQLSHYCFVLLHLAADTEAAVENTKKNGCGSSLSC